MAPSPTNTVPLPVYHPPALTQKPTRARRQALAGKALVCVLDGVRAIPNEEVRLKALAFIDDSQVSQSYMDSLDIAEKIIGAQLQIVGMIKRINVTVLSVLDALAAIVDRFVAVLEGVVNSLVKPILDLLRYEMCVDLFFKEICFSVQDILEGVASLFEFLLGWAEDLFNALLRPVWDPVERWVREVFAIKLPTFDLDWSWLPSFPDLPYLNVRPRRTRARALRCWECVGGLAMILAKWLASVRARGRDGSSGILVSFSQLSLSPSLPPLQNTLRL